MVQRTKSKNCKDKYLNSLAVAFCNKEMLNELDSYFNGVEERYREVVVYYSFLAVIQNWKKKEVLISYEDVSNFYGDTTRKNGIVLDYVASVLEGEVKQYSIIIDGEQINNRYLKPNNLNDGYVSGVIFNENDKTLNLRKTLKQMKKSEAKIKDCQLFSPILREEVESGEFINLSKTAALKLAKERLARKKEELEAEANKIDPELAQLMNCYHSSCVKIGDLREIAQNIKEDDSLFAEFTSECKLSEENIYCDCIKCSRELILSSYRSLEGPFRGILTSHVGPLYKTVDGRFYINDHLDKEITVTDFRTDFITRTANAQNLPSNLRKIAFPSSKGFFELDLKSAHLSFVAAISNNKYLQTKLKDNLLSDSFWLDICKEIGLAPELKSGLKLVINSKLYGSSKAAQKIYYWAENNEGSKLLVGKLRTLTRKKLFNSELADLRKSLLAMIDEKSSTEFELIINSQFYKEITNALKTISLIAERNGGLKDAWGHLIPNKNWKYTDEDNYEDEKNNSMLFRVCYSYEKYILFPVIRYYEGYPGRNRPENVTSYRLVLDQHDGLSVQFADKLKAEPTLEFLKKLVESRASKLNVNTTLVRK